MDTSWTSPVCGETVDGEVRLDALEGIHIRSPFDQSKTVEHREDADVDAVILGLACDERGWGGVPLRYDR